MSIYKRPEASEARRYRFNPPIERPTQTCSIPHGLMILARKFPVDVVRTANLVSPDQQRTDH